MSRWRQWRDHWSWQEEGWWIKAMQERGKVEKHETRFWSALQGWLVDHNSWSSQTNTINKQQGWLVALNICSYKPKPLTCWVISLLCLCLCLCVCLFHCLCHLQTLPWSYPYRKYIWFVWPEYSGDVTDAGTTSEDRATQPLKWKAEFRNYRKVGA